MSSAFKVLAPVAGTLIGGAFGMPWLGGAVGGGLGGASGGGGLKGALEGAALGGAGGYLAGLGGVGGATAGTADMGGAGGLTLGGGSLGLSAPSTGYFSGLGGATAGGLGFDAATAGSALTGSLGASLAGLGAGGGGEAGTTAVESAPSLSGLGMPVATTDYGLGGGSSGLGLTMPTSADISGGSLGLGGSAAGGDTGGFFTNLKDYLQKLGLTGKGGALQTMGKIGSGLNILSGLYGMSQARGLQSAMDPFAPYRAQYAQELQDLNANPSSMTSLPGYQAGLDAVQRSMAAQGYTGSGNSMLALQKYGQDFFAQQQARLAALAGAGAAPGAGAQAGAQLTSSALGTMGLGAAGLLQGA